MESPPAPETGAHQDRPIRILLAGGRNAGKTTCCMTAARLLRESGLRAGGVACPKLLDKAGRVLGLQVADLLHDPPRREVLARTDRALDGPRMGAYHFSREGLRFGRRALEAGARLADVVFADELGPLEMRGEGFSNLLDLARNPSTPPMVIVVRSALLPDVCKALEPIQACIVECRSSRPEETPAVLLARLCVPSVRLPAR